MKKVSTVLIFVLLIGCQLFMLGYGYKLVDEDEYYHFIKLFQTDINYKLVLLMLILFIIATILFFVYVSITFYLIIANKVLNLQLNAHFVYYLVSINLIITAFQVLIQEMISKNLLLSLYLNPLVLLSITIIFILLIYKTKRVLNSLLLSMLFYIVNILITLIFV
ncbi:hypothetical protein CEQ21_01345 [Niallia circulans]|uniref:Uncharacterized protein n=1 Tax=Niallia circulans TaxID=1397 RepID=A0A553SRN2_NIACI|nr:hypothetical protein CEQ21_01345 [Niallia circulans]